MMAEKKSATKTSKNPAPVAVASRSFSHHPILRQELLERYETVTFNDKGEKFAGESLVRFLKGHVKAITALEKLDDSILSQLPELQVIGKYGVGLDMIDLDALKRHGKKLGWTGGVNRRAVAELALTFMLMMLRKVSFAHKDVMAGNWKQHVGHLLSNRTVGIIGCGHVGKELVALLRPFECQVLAHDILDFPDFYRMHAVRTVGLEELLHKADVVSLHVPLDASTQGMLNRERLGWLRKEAVLINTARGSLVDEQVLKEMLTNGSLAAAAFDVFGVEPPADANLLKLPNFFCTPHIGGSSEEAILAMGRAAIAGLDA